MNVFVNNLLKEIPGTLTISEILPELNISSTRGIAIAVNNEVVSKLQWDSFFLKENDKVTLIKATQGG